MKTILLYVAILSFAHSADTSLAQALTRAAEAQLLSGKSALAEDTLYRALVYDEKCGSAWLALAKLRGTAGDKTISTQIYRRAAESLSGAAKSDALLKLDTLSPEFKKLRTALTQYCRDVESIAVKNADIAVQQEVYKKIEKLRDTGLLSDDVLPNPQRHQSSVNLMALCDPSRDAIDGTWTWQKNSELTSLISPGSASGAAVTKIQFPYQPPLKYELVVEYRRLDEGGTVGLLVPVAGVWSLWYQESTRLSLVGKSEFKPPRLVKAGDTCVLALRVSGTHIDAFMDGKKIGSSDTPEQAVEWTMKDHKALGIGTRNCRVEFLSAKLTELDGHGKILK